MIAEKIRSWLVRSRDTSNVTYSRFGRPGDPCQDDNPPPTTILVEPFNENAPEFMFLNWHVSKQAATFSCFGMAMVILTFISSFFEFSWYSHSKGADVSALLVMFIYLAAGVLVHYYVLFGIKKQNGYCLLPFIIVYTLMCSLESIGVLTILFKMVEAPPHRPTDPNSPLFLIMSGTIIAIAIQLIMLFSVVRCRQYLAMKTASDMEIKVAERSKIQNPSIRIVFTGPTVPGISNPNAENNFGQDSNVV